MKPIFGGYEMRLKFFKFVLWFHKTALDWLSYKILLIQT